MANELKLILDPVTQAGLTVQAKVRQQDCTQVGATVTMTEPQTACYNGDYDVSILADGDYSVEFLDGGTGRLVGDGVLQIADGAEVTPQDLASIKAKTDQLTFTVPGQVDSNIQYVNDIEVTGNGQEDSEWGPA